MQVGFSLIERAADSNGTASSILWMTSTAGGLFGSDRLVNEESLFSPTVELENGDQSEASKEIGSQYIAGPMLSEVNSRNPNQGYQSPEEDEQESSPPGTLQQCVNQEP